MKKPSKPKTDTISPHQMLIDPRGSLGLLALGEVGIKLWREAKIRAKKERREKK